MSFYFTNGKAHLFVDPSSSSDFQTGANFVYHVLDLDKRQWTRKGGVDARLGLIRGGVSLPVGWLLFNATGELIWVDFEQETRDFFQTVQEFWRRFSIGIVKKVE